MIAFMTLFRKLSLAVAALCASLLLQFCTGVALADPVSTQVVQVTIDPQTVLAPVTSLSFGINTSVYDSHLMDPVVSSLVKQAGFTVMRYPGGSTSDEYHWQSNTYTPQTENGKPGSVVPSNDFDHFIELAHASGAEPIITVNYRLQWHPHAAAATLVRRRRGWLMPKSSTTTCGIGRSATRSTANGFYGGGWENRFACAERRSGRELAQEQPAAWANCVWQKCSRLRPRDEGERRHYQGRRGTDRSRQLAGRASLPDWNSNVLKECGARRRLRDYPCLPAKSGQRIRRSASGRAQQKRIGDCRAAAIAPAVLRQADPDFRY